jgi:multidrug transporter EmrE-like cation transporter
MDPLKSSKAPLLADNEQVGNIINTKEKHWYWDDWKLLALSAALCFAVANLTIGDVAHLGFTSIFYFNSGALIVCVAYFTLPKFRGAGQGNPLNTNGKFDFHRLVLYIAGAVFGLGIYGAVNTTFYFCHRAGLNIGIAATIWGFTAILSSIMEYNFFNTELQKYHIFGLVHMLLAVMFISLSAGYQEDDQSYTPSAVVAA